MKKIIVKMVLFIAIYLIIANFISTLTPYHWGNPWYSSKIQYLEESNDMNYNTFFFGSSLVYRQIAPITFDSILNTHEKNNSNSFNLGAPATFTPQNYYLYENFLESPLSKNAKYCFIELREVDLLNDYFLHQERTTYWQNYSDLKFIFRSINENPKLAYKRKTLAYRNYLVSYFENLFHLGHFGQQLNSPNYYSVDYVGKNGFFPLQLQLEYTSDSVVKNNLVIRKNSIIKDPGLVSKRKQAVLKEYTKVEDNYDYTHLRKINALIEISKEKGIHLVFIISPRYITKELLNLSSQISSMHLIDMANPEKFETLYTIENSFDIGHLNTKGAHEYTKLLALEFLKIKARTNSKKYSACSEGQLP